MSWDRASSSCKYYGGELASASDSRTSGFIAGLISSGSVWLGGYRSTSTYWSSYGWKWMNGARFIYRNWNGGEPNNYGRGEEKIVMYSNGKWNDDAGYKSKSYVCQKSPGTGTCIGDTRAYEMKTCKKSVGATTIRPFAHTGWGGWGSWKYCPNGHYVRAIQLRIESPDGDDTALNAIRLTCSDGTVLVSNEGPWGSWRTKVWSNNYIIGVKLRTERGQGGGDDTAANGLRFVDCNGKWYYPGDGYWGDWSNTVYCPKGTVIRGFVTKNEAPISGDDTALNQVIFYCGQI